MKTASSILALAMSLTTVGCGNSSSAISDDPFAGHTGFIDYEAAYGSINFPFDVNAGVAWGHFKKNEIKADNYYREKFVHITGNVDTFGLDMFRNPYVTIKVVHLYDKSLSEMTLYYNKSDTDNLLKYKKGDRLRALCTNTHLELSVLKATCQYKAAWSHDGQLPPF